MIMLRILSITILTYLLAACSAHPGAGNWLTTGEENANFNTDFVRLEVGYEGRTNIFSSASDQQNELEQAIRRCFWRGEDAYTITLTCVQANNSDIEEHYKLRVNTQTNIAKLTRGGVTVGLFAREERPEIEHSYKEILQPR